MICGGCGFVDEWLGMLHAVGMSIRIREWGMLRNDAEQPHISLQGLTDWEGSARSAAQGVVAMVQGGTHIMQQRAEVAATGQLAAFSETLRSIEQETLQELQDTDPEDWDYAWQAASEPRVAAAIAELPVPLRENARQMAAAHTREASIRAWRDRELASIDKARGQWRQQVEAAVQAGDAEGARRWIQQGRGIFVPEARAAAEEKAVESRAQLQHWQQKLQQAPVQTLGDYLRGGRRQLPLRREEADQLKHHVEVARQQARRDLAATLHERALLGLPTPATEWMQAKRAGLISDKQYGAAQAEAHEPKHREYNEWLRKIDESEADPAQQLNLKLDVCTAPLPQQYRAQLLQRMEQAQSVRWEDRQLMSRKLWDLYHAGAFGCPGDEMAALRLRRLQMSGLPLLAESGNEAAAEWLESLDRRDEQWISFNTQYE